MEFEFLTGDVDWEEYGGKWISPKLSNGEFDYWLVIEFINFLDATGETIDGMPYNISISAVSPAEAGNDNVCRAVDSYGLSLDMEHTPEMIVEVLHGYGISAHLWSENGSIADAMLDLAKNQATLVSMLFGFYMDRPENALGSTGWDFIKGDILAGLERV